MTKMFGVGALAGLAMGAALVAAPAQALIVYNFEGDVGAVGSLAGSISYAGGATAATASGVTIEHIQRTGSALELTCNGCTITLTTGTFTGKTGDEFNFAGGGSFTISGDVGAGVEVLATGTVGESNFDPAPGGFLIGSFSDLVTSFVAASVQAAFGDVPVGGPVFTGFAQFSFSDLTPSASNFNSTSIAAVDAHLATPEPAALGLLGLGLVGLVAMRRRKVAA